MDLHNRQQWNRHEAWRGTHNRWNFHSVVWHTKCRMEVTQKHTHRPSSLLLLSRSQTHTHTHTHTHIFRADLVAVIWPKHIGSCWLVGSYRAHCVKMPQSWRRAENELKVKVTGWKQEVQAISVRSTQKQRGSVLFAPEGEARGRGPLIISESVAADSRHCGRQTRHSQQPTEAWGGGPTWVKTLCTIERQVAMVFWVFFSASVVLKRITLNI